MVVFVEASVLNDRLVTGHAKFPAVKDKLMSFRETHDDLTDKIDFIICLGGDGTLLYASSLFQVRYNSLLLLADLAVIMRGVSGLCAVCLQNAWDPRFQSHLFFSHSINRNLSGEVEHLALNPWLFTELKRILISISNVLVNIIHPTEHKVMSFTMKL